MNTREIQRLRIKFILVAMASILLSMFFICASINLANYFETRREIYKTLDWLIEKEEDIPEDARQSDKWNDYSWGNIFTPDYDQHIYYLFACDEETGVMEQRLSHNDDDSQEILPIAERFLKEEKDRGQYRSYYYEKKKGEDGVTALAILNGRPITVARLRVQYMSFSVVAAGMLLAFLLVVKISNRMIQPEIENSIRQDQFITNASHELKTPLAVIRSNTEMEELIRGESEWTQSTIRQVDRLTGLIQNLVMISKAREQESKTQMTEVNASEIVTDSVKAYEVVAVQDGKSISREIDPDVKLIADGSSIRQLTVILMDNACKYCDEGGVIQVSLQNARRKKGMKLVVSNTYAEGKNVDYRRFFDRFYREETDHNIDRGGYGIGLSIAESICQQYGGDIRADWKNGNISFTCTLY